MMNCTAIFPLVATAVDLERGSATHEELEQAIYTIINSYDVQLVGLCNINYSKAIFRSAYMYLYVTSHTRMVQDSLSTFWKAGKLEFFSWFKNMRAGGYTNVCCVGGGPGSDLFGYYLFALENDWTYGVNATILDLHPEWNKSVRCLTKQFNSDFIINQFMYGQFNIFDTDHSRLSTDAIKTADLVTMTKFVSAASKNKIAIRRKLREIFQMMKPGALLFFLDNAGGGNREMLERVVYNCEFICVDKMDHQFYRVPQEESQAVGRYKKRVTPVPQMTAKIATSLWRKKPTTGGSDHRLQTDRYSPSSTVRATTQNRDVNSSTRVQIDPAFRLPPICNATRGPLQMDRYSTSSTVRAMIKNDVDSTAQAQKTYSAFRPSPICNATRDIKNTGINNTNNSGTKIPCQSPNSKPKTCTNPITHHCDVPSRRPSIHHQRNLNPDPIPNSCDVRSIQPSYNSTYPCGPYPSYGATSNQPKASPNIPEYNSIRSNSRTTNLPTHSSNFTTHLVENRSQNSVRNAERETTDDCCSCCIIL